MEVKKNKKLGILIAIVVVIVLIGVTAVFAYAMLFGGIEVSDGIKMSKNCVYIEGTDIYGNLTVADLNQENVDEYDMVYSENLFNTYGPWIVGFWDGTFEHLPEVEVGSKVYITVDGNLKTYEVFISETATQNDELTDITCDESGYSIFEDFDEETLRMYTSYRKTGDHWVVFAKLIEE